MPSAFHWRKYRRNGTRCLKSYQQEWLYQSMVPFFSLSRMSGTLQPLAHPPSRGYRRGTMYPQKGPSFCSLIPHPIPSSYRQQWSRPINNTRTPSWQTKRASNWIFWVTRSSSLPAFNFSSPVTWLYSLHISALPMASWQTSLTDFSSMIKPTSRLSYRRENWLQRQLLQSAMHAANTSLHTMATGIVVRRESWLHSSGFSKEVQNTI